MYYIKETEPGLFTVGCDQQGEWEPFKDCDEEEAEALVNKLNGGNYDVKVSLDRLMLLLNNNVEQNRAWPIYVAYIQQGMKPDLATQYTKEAMSEFEQNFERRVECVRK